MNHLDQEFIEGSVPPGAFGNLPGSNISGLAMDSMLAPIKDLTLPYVNAWGHGQSLIVEQMLYHLRDRILPVLAGTDDQYGQQNSASLISAQQIRNVGCYVDVTLDEVGPDTKMQRVTTANQAVSAGLMSQRSGIEFIGTKDPDAEFRQIIAEKAMQNPQLMENFIIPAGFISQQEPDLAKMWLQLVVAPKLQQMQQQAVAGQPSAPQPAGPSQNPNAAQQSQIPPGGPAPGQGSVR
jgi:hypothetical protein